MEIDEYLNQAKTTAIFKKEIPECADLELVPLLYCGLKLNGEAGEVAEHVGKMLRDDEGVLTVDRRTKIIKELGDVIWYWVMMCDLIDVHPSEVMKKNIEKLAERMAKGTLGGSGSDR